MPYWDKVRDVIWVNARLDAEEAMQRAKAAGYQGWFRDLNTWADTLVGWGVGMYIEDCGAWALRQWESRRAYAHIRYPLGAYQQVRRVYETSAAARAAKPATESPD